MSQENVDVVRGFWDQWTEAGWAWDTWHRGEVDMSAIHPQVVYEDHNLPDHVGETYHGPQGVVRAAERWTEPFEWLAVEVERIVDFGDHLISFHRWRARFRHTGIEINEPLAYRWRFQDGKVICFCSLSQEEADEASRLAE
ncbi:MAG TPA: nuclear transport factor 2 family protein [Solirubrobacteraceae bacterium]|nr:nuclear transport factor 2 family protein [Solirubrobacteraceae bacterium]